MPHHAVEKEDKLTTNTRVVYDASSKSGGSSLNECLQWCYHLHRRISCFDKIQMLQSGDDC